MAHQDFPEFPIVCETCLGPNPYIRMQKFHEGGVCHISGRPYTSFRWKAGNDARYKKTVICQVIAKAKNVCQVCMLDLDYNLPVQIRDKAMNIQEETLPVSHSGKEYALNQMDIDEKKFNKDPTNDLLIKLAPNEPRYSRNRARICSFYVHGCCNRGVECPYRHEDPTTAELSKQSYHARYYGIDDPVANKMLARASKMPSLTPPLDLNIATLFIGNVTPAIAVQDLRDVFSNYGELESVKIFYLRRSAFVTYCSRDAAEKAAYNLNKCLLVKGNRLLLRWGKKQTQKAFKEKESKIYGAMDPNQFGSALKTGLK